MKRIVYATTNKNKLQQAQECLKGFSFQLDMAPGDLVDIPEIQDDSQEAVALDKAHKYYQIIKQPLIVMDSGLFIDGLKGFPGVYTKYALETIGVNGLLTLTKELDNRRAYTERTVVYIDANTTKLFSLRCKGAILDSKRGDQGRDYDFIFCVDSIQKTLAEMSGEERLALVRPMWRELGEWIERI